jgi:hypothetical protein
MDIIFLIHHATLELYGIKIDASKTAKLAGLLKEVAEGKRTFIDSNFDPNVKALGDEINLEAEPIDFDDLLHEERMKERNAARGLMGLPPLEG